MTDTPTVEQGAPETEAAHDHEEHPRGTMLLMLLYLIVIVAMWGYIYMMMVGRG